MRDNLGHALEDFHPIERLHSLSSSPHFFIFLPTNILKIFVVILIKNNNNNNKGQRAVLRHPMSERWSEPWARVQLFLVSGERTSGMEDLWVSYFCVILPFKQTSLFLKIQTIKGHYALQHFFLVGNIFIRTGNGDCY